MGCKSISGITFACTHLYTWVEGGTVRVKCLTQEHNTISPARAQIEQLNLESSTLTLNTEWAYKWKLSGSAHQSEIGILCFDWLIPPGVSYSREFEFSPNGKEVLRLFMASSLESSISYSTLLFRRNLTLPFFKFCCFQFLCTEYGTVWGITQCCSICISFAPS